jgi:hypothetical protein
VSVGLHNLSWHGVLAQGRAAIKMMDRRTVADSWGMPHERGVGQRGRLPRPMIPTYICTYIHADTYMRNLHNLQLNHRSSASVQKKLAEPPSDKIQISVKLRATSPRLLSRYEY